MIASHTKMALHDLRFGMQVIRRALEHDMSIVEYIHQIGKTQYRQYGSKRNTPQAGMGCQLWVYAAGDVGRCGGADQDLLSSGGGEGYEAKQHIQFTVGDVLFRPWDNRLVRPVIIARGMKEADMMNPADSTRSSRSRLANR
jgi:hypothetical protein